MAYKMPKLSDTYVRKLPQSKTGTKTHWDSEVKGFVLYVGKQSKTWYFQKDIGGQTKRVLIGRYPTISASAARETALGFTLDWSRGAGKRVQVGAPVLETATETYLARPKLRSDSYKIGMRQQFDKHLKDWLRLPLNEISKSMVADRHRSLAKFPSTSNHFLKGFRSV